MNKIFLISFSFLFYYSSFSQNSPWNTKFIISYQNGNQDTVWVGCDTSATDGYDTGLEIIDTTFSKPIGILAHNAEVEQLLG